MTRVMSRFTCFEPMYSMNPPMAHTGPMRVRATVGPCR